MLLALDQNIPRLTSLFHTLREIEGAFRHPSVANLCLLH